MVDVNKAESKSAVYTSEAKAAHYARGSEQINAFPSCGRITLDSADLDRDSRALDHLAGAVFGRKQVTVPRIAPLKLMRGIENERHCISYFVFALEVHVIRRHLSPLIPHGMALGHD